MTNGMECLVTNEQFDLLRRTTNIVIDTDDDHWEFIGNNKTQDLKDFRRLGIEINCMTHSTDIENGIGRNEWARVWVYKRECHHEDPKEAHKACY